VLLGAPLLGFGLLTTARPFGDAAPFAAHLGLSTASLAAFNGVAVALEGRAGRAHRPRLDFQRALAGVAVAVHRRGRRREAAADPRVVEVGEAVALEAGQRRGDVEEDVAAVGADSVHPQGAASEVLFAGFPGGKLG